MAVRPNQSRGASDWETKSLFQLIEEYIKKSGLSVPQVARALAIKDSKTIYGWLDGQHAPAEKHIYNFIGFLQGCGLIDKDDLAVAEHLWQLASDLSNGKGYAPRFERARLFETRRPGNILLPPLKWKFLKSQTLSLLGDHQEEISRKFEKEQTLYLQREETLGLFEDFLASDKIVFLLLGSSGAGKTFFSLSLVHRYETNSRLAVLYYNAAHLPAEGDWAGRIALDLGLYAAPVQEPSSSDQSLPPSPLFARPEMDKIMANRQLLVILDGLNEKEAPQNLLLQVKNLLDEGFSHPWFKLLLTSRPEAWRNLRRGVNLSENYFYRLKGLGLSKTSALSYRLSRPTSFGPNIELPPFNSDEVVRAYQNYRQVYALQSEFAELSSRTKELIKDPLNLSITALIYKGQKIPATLDPTRLYQMYLNHLFTDGKLQEPTLAFLQNELMPLMLSNDHASNLITYEQILSSITYHPVPLYQLVFPEKTGSYPLHLINAYQNLVDAGILLHHEVGPTFWINFKYERFYDYHAGKRLLQLAGDLKQPEKDRFYLGVIKQLPEKPYLWGPLTQALVAETASNGPALLINLAGENLPNLKRLLVSVGVELARNQPASGKKILNELLLPFYRKVSLTNLADRLPVSRNRTLKNKVKELTASVKVDGQNFQAGLIAVESAGALGFVDLLEAAARSESEALRDEAVRATFHLYQRQPEKGFLVLEGLTHAITHFGFVPDQAVLGSILGLGAAIFFEPSSDTSALTRAQAVCRTIIAELLGLPGSKNPLRLIGPGLWKKGLVFFVTRTIFKWFESMPPYNQLNYPDLALFFTSTTPKEREIFKRLVLYLNPYGAYSRSQLEKDYLSVINTSNELFDIVVTYGLMAQFVADPTPFLPFLKTLFEKARQNSEPNLYLSTVVFALTAGLEKDPFNEAAFEFFVEATGIVQEYYTCHPHMPGKAFIFPAPETIYLGPYISFYYQREGNLNSAWLRQRIDTALQNRNLPFFDLLINSELTIIGIETGSPLVALEALAYFINEDWPDLSAIIIKYLARLHLYYPDEVESFIEDQANPSYYREALKQIEAPETVGSLIGMRIWYFFQAEITSGSPTIRQSLQEALLKAADFDNLNEWLDYLIRTLINQVYGKPIL